MPTPPSDAAIRQDPDAGQSPTLTRPQAIEWLVTTAHNNPDWEWVAWKALACRRGQCSREGVEAAIHELAAAHAMRTDDGIVPAVADRLIENAALFDS